RSRQLVKKQYALLCSGLIACRPGGVIVYATCSISPAENDGVIERFIDRKGGAFDVLPIRAPMGCPTRFGWSVLPDVDGWGPIFLSRLRKRS
ncbi:MAG TPA: hypothetical protein PKX94_02665, partial [Opitutales bacterium]|nr:hypothetical protein [Opitutales bacterium]